MAKYVSKLNTLIAALMILSLPTSGKSQNITQNDIMELRRFNDFMEKQLNESNESIFDQIRNSDAVDRSDADALIEVIRSTQKSTIDDTDDTIENIQLNRGSAGVNSVILNKSALKSALLENGIPSSIIPESYLDDPLSYSHIKSLTTGYGNTEDTRIIKKRYLAPAAISENSRLFLDPKFDGNGYTVKRVYGPDDRFSPIRVGDVVSGSTTVPVGAFLGDRKVGESESSERKLSNGSITLDQLVDLSRSVAIIVEKDRLSLSADETYYTPSLLTHRQRTGLKLCEKDSFKGRLSLGYCSAFLANANGVASRNLLASAEHCVRGDPAKNLVVFGFDDAAPSMRIPVENVFEVADFGFYSNIYTDTSVIKLKRDVPEALADPMTISSGPVNLTDPVCFMGYPDGTPKVVGCGTQTYVKSLHIDRFEASVDTNRGNSGGPIVNANTLETVGILVGGGTDYVRDDAEGCYITDVVSISVPKFEQASYVTWVAGRMGSL